MRPIDPFKLAGARPLSEKAIEALGQGFGDVGMAGQKGIQVRFLSGVNGSTIRFHSRKDARIVRS